MANFIVAITGGIASGKSAVTRLFSECGIGVSDADIAARRIVEPGQPALSEIIACFGTQVIVDGQLDRHALRDKIFDNVDAKKKLESIMHPRIRDLLMQECTMASSAYAVVAIPLLVEANHTGYNWISRILVVDVPPEIQKLRLIARDGISDTLADKILKAQATRGQRLAIADDVVTNVHDLQSLGESVRRLDQRYRKLAMAAMAKTG